MTTLCLSKTDVIHFPIAFYGQVTQSGHRYRWLISYMTSHCDGTPGTYLHTVYVSSKYSHRPTFCH